LIRAWVQNIELKFLCQSLAFLPNPVVLIKAEKEIENICLEFEQLKPHLVENWNKRERILDIH
jgi:hypothetical protein